MGSNGFLLASAIGEEIFSETCLLGPSSGEIGADDIFESFVFLLDELCIEETWLDVSIMQFTGGWTYSKN